MKKLVLLYVFIQPIVGHAAIMNGVIKSGTIQNAQSSIPSAAASAGLSFDNAGSAVGTLLQDESFSFTTSGSNRYMQAIVAIRCNIGQQLSAITYNGTNMVFVSSRPCNGIRLYLYELLNPALGANTLDATTDLPADYILGAISFNGANTSDASGPESSVDDVSASATSISVAAVSNAGEICVKNNVIQTDVTASYVDNGGETSRILVQANGSLTLAMSTKNCSASSTSMGGSWTGGNRTELSVYAVKP